MEFECINCLNTVISRSKRNKHKYCSNKCQSDYLLDKKFINGTNWSRRMGIYLKELRGNKCENCGIENWNGKELTFQIDHINGDRKDNRYINLKILCPNCHTQRPTWGIGNMSETGKKRLISGAMKGNKNFNSKRGLIVNRL